MKVRATITIDIDAADFIEAAEHQRRVETILGEVKKVYGAAVLDFRERRTSRRDRVRVPPPPRPISSKTGRLKTYVD
jgi:hypothetical protein